eukprot:TRINITY_DN797_c0_g1_i1.p1 TRINITY_DN797_c0_g1~~TRINITY_DN797_c0_g1_i1.p1  ORF type:complete len:537 (+),score=106.78 TRINITY_DN797_c0_g1_i1:51-1613(+)
MDLDDVTFVSPPSENLYCPICTDLFEQPVITRECSHSFCSKCIYRIENSTCPLCRHKISLNDTHSNLILNEIIKDLKVYCKYKDLGCQVENQLGNRKPHEKECPFAPTSCPNSDIGCKVSGSRREVDEHKSVCVFEQLKPFIQKTTKMITEMKHTIDSLTLEVKTLREELVNGGSLKKEDPKTLSLDEKISSKEEEIIDFEPKSLSPKEKWDVQSFQCAVTLNGHTMGVTCLLEWSEKKLLFSGSHDTMIMVWDLNKINQQNSEEDNLNCCIAKMKGHFYTVWALALSKDGSKLFSGSSDSTIKCWNTNDYSLIWTCPDTFGKIYSLTIDGDYLYSAGNDRAIKVWNVESLECEATITGHTACIWHVVSDGNGKIYTSSDDGTVRIWNIETRQCEKVITLNCHIVSLAVGCGFICLGSDDCKIKVYGESAEFITEFSEHKWEVWQLLIRDNLLFSGSFDHTVKVWDLETFQCLKTLQGHKGYVHSLSISGYHLCSGSGDKTIKVWCKYGLNGSEEAILQN